MEKKPRQLWILYGLSFIGDFTNSLFTTVTILYATLIGSTPLEVGWVGAAFGLTYLIAPIIIGRIVDKITRKQSLLIATSGQIIIALFYFLTPRTAIFFIIGHLLLGIIYGFFWPAVEARISDITEHSSHPRAHEIGFFNFCVAWGIGYAIGPWVSGFLAKSLIDIAFLLGLGFYILGFLASLIGLERETERNNKMDKKSIKEHNKEQTLADSNDPRQIQPKNGNKTELMKLTGVLLFVVTMNTSAVKIFIAYFPNYAARPDGLNWDPLLIGNVALAFGLARFSFFLIGRIWHIRFRLFIIAFAIVTVILIIVPMLSSPFFLGVLFCIAGFLLGLNYIGAIHLTMQLESHAKGTKAGLFESCVGFGSSISPVIAGFLATVSYAFPFYIFAACLIGVIIILAANMKNPLLSTIENIK